MIIRERSNCCIAKLAGIGNTQVQELHDPVIIASIIWTQGEKVKLFGAGSGHMLGIDISSMSVKLLELGQSGQRSRIERYGVVPMPPNAFVNNDIKDVEAVGGAIKQLKTRTGTDAKYASVAISSSSVITRVMQLEFGLDDYEMENQILVEADKYIPYALDEVRIDFDVLGRVEENPELVDVLVVACRSESIDMLSDALQLGGIVPKVVDVECYAMERAAALIMQKLPNGGENMNIGIIDMGAAKTTLTVMNDLSTIYTHEEIIGGKHLTQEFQQRYGLTYGQAGIVKKQGGLKEEDGSTEILQMFEEALLPHVRRSLEFFFSAATDNEVNHLVLAGGNARINGITDLIEDRLGIPATIANPFSDMLVSSKVNAKSLQNDAPSLMIACGLAMRGLE